MQDCARAERFLRRSGAGNGDMPSARKARETEEIFRDANRSIRDVAAELGVDGPVPFLCECADPSCRALIRLKWSEFAGLLERPNRFALLPGHQIAEVEEVVRQAAGYIVVEKASPA